MIARSPRRFLVLASVLLAVATALPCGAQDRSPDELLRAAQTGDAEAQYLLGRAYYWGLGIGRDKTEAAKWYRLAAEQGHPNAQSSLGWAYEWGFGVAQDDRESAKWYRLAAEQGHSSAQSSLGQAYAEGKGVEKDEAEAVRWFRLSAEQHDPAGQYGLAEMVEAGRGVAKDEKEAARWYERAAGLDFSPAQTALAAMYAQGRGVEKNPICAYLWYGLAAKKGSSGAEEGRDAIAATLSPADLAEARRLVAKSRVDNDVVIHPLCPGERLSGTVRGVPWDVMLQMFRTQSGLEIEAPPGATGTLDLLAEDVTWEEALTDALQPKGYRWKREGDRIVILPLAPEGSSDAPETPK